MPASLLKPLHTITSPARIDPRWRHLWRPGSLILPLWEGAGSARDLVSRNLLALTAAAWKPTPFGPGLQFIRDQNSYAAISGHQQTDFTFECLFIPTATTNGGIMGIAESPGSGTTDRILGLRSGVYQFYVFADGGLQFVNSGVSPVAGAPTILHATAKAPPGGNYTVSVNGVPAGSLAVTGSAYEGYSTPELILGYTGSGQFESASASGYIVWAASYPYVMSDQEIAARAQDLFSVVRPLPLNPAWFVEAPGGGPVVVTGSVLSASAARSAVSLAGLRPIGAQSPSAARSDAGGSVGRPSGAGSQAASQSLPGGTRGPGTGASSSAALKSLVGGDRAAGSGAAGASKNYTGASGSRTLGAGASSSTGARSTAALEKIIAGAITSGAISTTAAASIVSGTRELGGALESRIMAATAAAATAMREAGADSRAAALTEAIGMRVRSAGLTSSAMSFTAASAVLLGTAGVNSRSTVHTTVTGRLLLAAGVSSAEAALTVAALTDSSLLPVVEVLLSAALGAFLELSAQPGGEIELRASKGESIELSAGRI